MRAALLFFLFIALLGGTFAQVTAPRTDDAITKEVALRELRVYPNPTDDDFSVRGDVDFDEVVVYNIIGKKVKTYNRTASNKYSLRDMPDGMYFISIVDQNSGVLKTLRINKRVMRP